VRHAPSIAHDANGLRELSGGQRSRDLRQRSDTAWRRLTAASHRREDAQQDGRSN
jgi:hypothetical protein